MNTSKKQCDPRRARAPVKPLSRPGAFHSPATPATPVSVSVFAFTLVELLTVIAIIGVLAGILIPTVGKVRESAHSAKCLSNLRQIGTGIRVFAEENKGNLPVPQDDDGLVVGEDKKDIWWAKWWMAQIQPYTEGRDPSRQEYQANFDGIFRCPSKKEWKIGSGVSSPCEVSYAMSTLRNVWNDVGEARKAQHNLSKFQNPSITALVVDQASKRANETEPTFGNPYITDNSFLYRDYVELRHNNKHHCVFLDEHVKALGMNALNRYLMIENGNFADDKIKPY
jgi:general secretion pathway protein G